MEGAAKDKSVIVVFPGHIHLFFCDENCPSQTIGGLCGHHHMMKYCPSLRVDDDLGAHKHIMKLV